MDDKPHSAEDPEKRAVLIVDDSPIIGRVLQISLQETYGYEVDLAEGGNDAINRLESGYTPDAILSDINMPDGNGPELYDWIKKNRAQLAERIIFMTGHAGKHEGFAEMMAWSGRILEKPFGPDDVRDKIEEVLGNRMDIE